MPDRLREELQVQSFFNRLTGRSGRCNPFDDWPPPPAWMGSPPVAAPGILSPLVAEASSPEPDKYGPALVIALGRAGEAILQDWLNLLETDPAGPQSRLRVITITNGKPAAMSSRLVNVRAFDLEAGARAASPGINWRCQRERLYQLFRLAVNDRPFEEYLSLCLRTLKDGTQVFVVASLSEAEIGLLGPVLQAVRQNSDFPLSITVLLTLTAPVKTLSDGEIYAALREIGRFTFVGPHWMGPAPELYTGVVHSTLVDQILWLEARGAPPNSLDLSGLAFQSGLGRAAGEILFYLIHPSGKPILDELRNQPAADRRVKNHQPLVHSLGIATLYAPQRDLEQYTAVRLAQAALFGENEDRRSEALAPCGPESQGSGEMLARQWLSQGPCSHPFFSWLLETASFQLLPPITPDYKRAFKVQVAAGMGQLLNDSQQVNRLDQVRLALEWLKKHFAALQTGLRGAGPGADRANASLLEDFLSAGGEFLRILVGETTAWQAALYAQGSAPSPHSRFFDLEDIETVLQTSRDWAEERLHQSMSGKIRRSVLESAEDESAPQRYYEQTVRPELLNGRSAGTAFRRVRERLGWWVRPDDPPRLFLVCYPPESRRDLADEPLPENALWRPSQAAELVRLLIELGRNQARGLSSDLHGAWLLQRFQACADFLESGGSPLIHYDQETTAGKRDRVARRSYLIGVNKEHTGSSLAKAYPWTDGVHELDGGPVGRLAALTLEMLIPLPSIYSVKKLYPSYGHQESYHLYLQEQLAVRYERRIRYWDGWHELSPELVVALADPQRVTLFCQALFYGLIRPIPDSRGQQLQWSLILGEGERPYLLANDSKPASLLAGFRAFTVERPFVHNLEAEFTSPFHPSRYPVFVKWLGEQIRQRRSSPDYLPGRRDFEKNILSYWAGETDRLHRSFYNLLRVELEEPIWKDE